jgi:predicted nucleic acid-binding protein
MLLPIAVADTSVLIALHHLDLLSQLSVLFHRVLIPAEVRTEFLSKDTKGLRGTALSTLISGAVFFPCDDYDTAQVQIFLLSKLDPGEAEVLSQAKNAEADVILIDEKKGRKIAALEHREVRGTIGILARMHYLGIADIWTSVERLEKEIQFRLKKEDVVVALKEARGDFA